MDTAPYSSAAVFIASSDNTRDVFIRVFPSLLRHWPECRYPIYAGFNQPVPTGGGFTPVYAPASGWRDELAAQLEQVRADHVLMLLDDFLFLGSVDAARIAELIEIAARQDLPYLRLIPVRRALLPRFALRWLRRGEAALEPVPESDPYYTSLQAVIWRRSYLLECLRLEKNIWKFEELRPPGGVHYAVSRHPPIPYRHVVEKGRWLPDARWLLRRAGMRDDLGSRLRWPWRYHLRRCAGLLWFEAFGYSLMRIRRMRAALRGRLATLSRS
jgi:hypothetical protein